MAGIWCSCRRVAARRKSGAWWPTEVRCINSLLRGETRRPSGENDRFVQTILEAEIMQLKRKWSVIWIAIVLVALVAFASGCKKKTPPPPPPPPPKVEVTPPPPAAAPDI